MILRRVTPQKWRKGWTLHRAQVGQTRNGTPKRVYDMEHPDFVGVDGTPSGVCWQILSGDAAVKELGETYTSGAAFELFFEDLEISVFDRCVFDGGVWEVRSIQRWSKHRRVALSEVRHG